LAAVITTAELALWFEAATVSDVTEGLAMSHAMSDPVISAG
jgi:hypothetical protein